MNGRQALQALRNNWLLRLENPNSVLHQPFAGYEGILVETFEDVKFLLDGRKGRKGVLLWVKPEELVIVRRGKSDGKTK